MRARNEEVFCVGPWHQDVMAKRILWGVWKVNGRKAHTAEKWSLDKRKSYNRSYARSRDCYTTDAHRAISV